MSGLPGVVAGGTAHATAIVIGEDGMLIRGPSGSGKSRLAREVIEGAAEGGRFSRLVADDRVALCCRGGRLIARPAPSLAGILEIRGVGLVQVPYEPAALIRLVVDILDEAPRFPEPGEAWAELLSVRLPRLAVNFPSAPGVVLWRLRAHFDAFVTVP